MSVDRVCSKCGEEYDARMGKCPVCNPADPIIHVWITKYALTDGIVEVKNARHCVSTSVNMIDCPSLGVFATFHGEGKEWHRTRESAVKRAEAMRVKKIAAYKKSIKKLEALKFE